MLRRIPVSLKFDDETEAEFYYELIEQKRVDRELSNLILDLLHVYYENEEVHTIVDNYQDAKNPYRLIQEDLKRIALEHSRNMMSASMLSDYTENEKKIYEKNQQASAEPEVKPEDIKIEQIEGAVDKNPEYLNNLKDRYDLIGKSDARRYVEELDRKEAEQKKVDSESIVEPEVKVEQSKTVAVVVETEVVAEHPKASEPIAESKPAEKPQMPILEKPKGKTKASSEGEQKTDGVKEQSKEVETKPKARKPASFGKLMKSMETES